jgi:hypothetical protein
MGQHENPELKIVAVHAEAAAERLFFAQYRLWMASHASQDPVYLDCAFEALLHFVAQDSARVLYAEFGLFTRTLAEQTRRVIRWRLSRCRCLCRDEFLVLRLAAASQGDDLAEEHLAATEILGTEYVKPLLTASRSLARALELRHFVLAPIEYMTGDETMPSVRHGWTLQ